MSTLIIAEAGVNHNGQLKLALELVDAAKSAGADVVKFQTFIADKLVTKDAEQAEYQKNNIGREESQWQMLKALELTYEEHMQVKTYCQQKKIAYLSTAFDLDSLAFLNQTMELPQLKIPSGEITNAPYLLAHAQTGCDLIVSTGMCTLEDITQALSIIAFGFINIEGDAQAHTNKNLTALSLTDFEAAYKSTEGQKLLKEKVTLLHCTTDYPAPIDEVNLRAMDLMHEKFGLPVGYSDHTEGIVVPIAAVSLGACIIEKHFTLDRNMKGPDHKASIEPDELADMVQQIRQVEKALGRRDKNPVASEIKNMAIARKSIVAAKSIAQGETFSQDNLTIKRPGSGLAPINIWQLFGQASTKAYAEGELIDS